MHQAAALMLRPLEWKTVSQALRQAQAHGCRGVMPPARLSRIFSALVGRERTRPLPDPRLETLRHYACRLYWRDAGAEKLGQALVDLGYSSSQIEAIAALARY